MTGGGAIKAGRAIAIGGSAGGLEALSVLLAGLPASFLAPLLVVLHMHSSDRGALAEHLARLTRRKVVEPCDKEPIQPGRVYLAPANYHILVEHEGIISLSTEEKVNWSRPSIDVLMESAAVVWGEGLTAILLSGANADGVLGLAAVKAAGGLTIAQNPAEASCGVMPRTAISAGVAELVLDVAEIARRLPDLWLERKTEAALRTTMEEDAP